MKWEKVKLGEVAEFVNGFAFKPEDWKSEGVPIIRIQNLTGQSKTFNYSKKEVPIKFHVYTGDLLVSWSATLGVYVWEGDQALLNQHIFKVTPNLEKVNSDYLRCALKISIEEMSRFTHGSTMKHINRGEFLGTKIPLPPLKEQQRIASILDAADALRRVRRQSLAKLDELAQSLFLEMFGDPVTNPKGWEVSSIENLCTLVRGSSPRPKGDARYYGGPVPRLMVADLTRDGFVVTPKIDSLTEEGAKLSRPVPAGTIVMAVSGNVGLTSQLAIDACIHDGFVAFLNLNQDHVNPTVFVHLLHYLKFTHTNRTAGAIFQNTTTSDIKAMPIPLPPLPLQQAFAQQIEELEIIKARGREQLLELDALFVSLQDRAFNGEL